MKKLLLLNSFALIILFGTFLNANAQREVIIEGFPITGGGGNIDDYADVINLALEADAANRETDPNVVYILKRNQLYPNSNTIKNTFPLRMKAEDGTGALPAIIQWADSQGKYKRHLEAQADVYFENIQFENQQADGGITVRSQRLVANGIRGVFKGCVFYQDGGGCITAWADSIKIYAYDCIAHSIGRVGENNSNGRFVDTRMDNWCDTVIIQNCTADHLNGAFFRGGSAITGYLMIDHCTSFNNRDAAINAFRPKEAIITNNLFMNSQLLGDVPSLVDPLDTDPDHLHNVLIDFDSIWDASKITIRNNNIFNTQEVKDMWAKYDTIFEPLRVDPLAMRMLGADSVNAAFSEVVNLKSICSAPLSYIEAIIQDVSLGIYPNQLCLGADGGLFPDQIDAGYETTSRSYTAADGKYPVGDLNWFPELRKKWATGEPAVGVKDYNLYNLSVYPNPAKDKLFVNTGEFQTIQFTIYNNEGKIAQSGLHNGGQIEMDLSALKKGLYIYRISDVTNNLIQSGKLMIAK